MIIAATRDETSKKKLESLSGDAFSVEIHSKCISVLDLLEDYPSAEVTFAEFLSMLPQLRRRCFRSPSYLFQIVSRASRYALWLKFFPIEKMLTRNLP